MTKKELFYHFTSETLRDGSPIPPIGEWLTFKGIPKICYCGLHASRHPFDALTFAPGKFLHMVELEGIETEHNDKVVAHLTLASDATRAAAWAASDAARAAAWAASDAARAAQNQKQRDWFLKEVEKEFCK